MLLLYGTISPLASYDFPYGSLALSSQNRKEEKWDLYQASMRSEHFIICHWNNMLICLLSNSLHITDGMTKGSVKERWRFIQVFFFMLGRIILHEMFVSYSWVIAVVWKQRLQPLCRLVIFLYMLHRFVRKTMIKICYFLWRRLTGRVCCLHEKHFPLDRSHQNSKAWNWKLESII